MDEVVMRVAFRVDASTRIGTGHQRRSASLAAGLRETGSDIAWVSRDLGIKPTRPVDGGADALFALPAPSELFQPQAGDPVHAPMALTSWQPDADDTIAALRDFAPTWIVLDHYAFDARWMERVRAALGAKICVIDDLADRPLAADVLVDHNLDVDHRAKYSRVAGAVERLLGGPRFALLSEAFRDARPCEPHDPPRSIGIFLGGTDPWGLSSVALRACREVAKFDGEIEVVTTSANPNLAALSRDCAQAGAQLLLDLPDLAEFFARHDLQIGAGGGAALERCRVGAPSVGLVCAQNQARVIKHLAAAGAMRKVPANEAADIGRVVAELLASPEACGSMSKAARRLVDGRGAQRVAVALAADGVTLRRAQPEDAELVYGWRKDPRTWRHFRHPGSVNHAEHLAWWGRTLQDDHRRLLIACCGEVAVGTLRFDIDDGAAEVSIYLDPGLTGLGLGASLLRAGQRWIAADSPRLTRLLAEIQEANKASAAVFGSAGFVQVAPTQWCLEIRH
ncbi:MAG TPA: UDP-2,4-diacetamido-2,4,6-trideoxy-beta-L-altropyranose hydrolase [Burkholderiales bacterium]|nr:UDP-2,4-diacetamido-2,4,6-trideoxy-beta-L-altropyranose hydrolase [Burkholderiales bacterium]